MRKLNLIAIAISCILLAACTSVAQPAQTSAGATSYQSVMDGKPADPKYFKSEIETAYRDALRPLTAHCANSDNVDKLQLCFRDQIVLGFDSSGKGRQECRDVADFTSYFECIVIGNMAEDLSRHLPAKDRPPMTSHDWLQAKPYIEKVSVKAVLVVMNLCLEANADEAIGCLRAELAKLFGVNDKLRQRCDSLKETDEFSTCIGEAYGLQFVNQGIARMNSVTL